MMNIPDSTTETTALAASVAPEDLKCEEYVTVLKEIVELPSFFWLDTTLDKPEQLVRVRCIPAESGIPLKIKAICLPFVFVKPPFGPCETIDVRRVQLARLDESYAKRVRKKLRKQQSPHGCQTSAE